MATGGDVFFIPEEFYGLTSLGRQLDQFGRTRRDQIERDRQFGLQKDAAERDKERLQMQKFRDGWTRSLAVLQASGMKDQNSIYRFMKSEGLLSPDAPMWELSPGEIEEDMRARIGIQTSEALLSALESDDPGAALMQMDPAMREVAGLDPNLDTRTNILNAQGKLLDMDVTDRERFGAYLEAKGIPVGPEYLGQYFGVEDRPLELAHKQLSIAAIKQQMEARAQEMEMFALRAPLELTSMMLNNRYLMSRIALAGLEFDQANVQKLAPEIRAELARTAIATTEFIPTEIDGQQINAQHVFAYQTVGESGLGESVDREIRAGLNREWENRQRLRAAAEVDARFEKLFGAFNTISDMMESGRFDNASRETLLMAIGTAISTQTNEAFQFDVKERLIRSDQIELTVDMERMFSDLAMDAAGFDTWRPMGPGRGGEQPGANIDAVINAFGSAELALEDLTVNKDQYLSQGLLTPEDHETLVTGLRQAQASGTQETTEETPPATETGGSAVELAGAAGAAARTGFSAGASFGAAVREAAIPKLREAGETISDAGRSMTELDARLREDPVGVIGDWFAENMPDREIPSLRERWNRATSRPIPQPSDPISDRARLQFEQFSSAVSRALDVVGTRLGKAKVEAITNFIDKYREESLKPEPDPQRMQFYQRRIRALGGDVFQEIK